MLPGDKRFARVERNPRRGLCPPCARPDRPRSRSRRERRGCTGYRVAFRKCGRKPPQQCRCVWRSSYEPPVRGHRHYRQIAITKTWTHVSAGQNELVLGLAVVALLLLLGLLCCVVLVVFLFGGSRLPGTGLGGRDRALDFAHARF